MSLQQQIDYKESSAALSISNLSKRYNNQIVFKDISCEVLPGSLTLLLGANGSGKSTLLKACVGLTRPDRGNVAFERLPKGKIPHSQLAFLGHDLFLYSFLTVEENLKLAQDVQGLSLNREELLFEWGLESHRFKVISDLSRGLRLRAALMKVFAVNPKYIILDEPTSFLDEDGVNRLVENIQRMRKIHPRGCVLIATHDISRLKEFADRFIYLRDGSLVLDTPNKDIDLISFYTKYNR